MTSMTQAEKQAFLADVHVGVLALNDGVRGPLMVPMWYEYELGGELWFLTGPQTRKGRLIQVGTRVSLVAQTEDAPYQYVSVEGPVTAIAPADPELKDYLWPCAISARRRVNNTSTACPSGELQCVSVRSAGLP